MACDGTWRAADAIIIVVEGVGDCLAGRSWRRPRHAIRSSTSEEWGPFVRVFTAGSQQDWSPRSGLLRSTPLCWRCLQHTKLLGENWRTPLPQVRPLDFVLHVLTRKNDFVLPHFGERLPSEGIFTRPMSSLAKPSARQPSTLNAQHAGVLKAPMLYKCHVLIYPI